MNSLFRLILRTETRRYFATQSQSMPIDVGLLFSNSTELNWNCTRVLPVNVIAFVFSTWCRLSVIFRHILSFVCIWDTNFWCSEFNQYTTKSDRSTTILWTGSVVHLFIHYSLFIHSLFIHFLFIRSGHLCSSSSTYLLRSTLTQTNMTREEERFSNVIFKWTHESQYGLGQYDAATFELDPVRSRRTMKYSI